MFYSDYRDHLGLSGSNTPMLTEGQCRIIFLEYDVPYIERITDDHNYYAIPIFANQNFGKSSFMEEYGYMDSYEDYLDEMINENPTFAGRIFSSVQEAQTAWKTGDFLDPNKHKMSATYRRQYYQKNKKLYEDLKALCDEIPIVDIHLIDRHYYSLFEITTWNENILLQNARDESLNLKDVVCKFYYVGNSFQSTAFLTRMSISVEEYYRDFYHSHSPSRKLFFQQWGNVCWGDMSSKIIKKFNDPETFKEGIMQLSSFLAFESIDGGPWRFMRDIYNHSDDRGGLHIMKDVLIHKMISQGRMEEYLSCFKVEEKAYYQRLSDRIYSVKCEDPVKLTSILKENLEVFPDINELGELSQWGSFYNPTNKEFELPALKYLVDCWSPVRQDTIKQLEDEFMKSCTLTFKGKKCKRTYYELPPIVEDDANEPNSLNWDTLYPLVNSLESNLNKYVREKIKNLQANRFASETVFNNS